MIKRAGVLNIVNKEQDQQNVPPTAKQSLEFSLQENEEQIQQQVQSLIQSWFG